MSASTLISIALSLLVFQDSVPFYYDKQDLLYYLDDQSRPHPIQTPSDWSKRRLHILAHMQKVMGRLPESTPVVTSCGFNSFAKYMGGDLSGWSHKGYMPRIAEVYSKNPSQMPFDFTEVLATLAPRPVFVNAPLGDSNFEVSGVRDCIGAALPVYEKVYGVRNRLVAVYPDAAHEFPQQIRQLAYEFLDRWLKLP